jgi:CheY-like chemotaxis protein
MPIMSQARFSDGSHQLIATRLETWPLMLVADTGIAQSADIATVIRRFGGALGLMVIGAGLLLAGIVPGLLWFGRGKTPAQSVDQPGMAEAEIANSAFDRRAPPSLASGDPAGLRAKPPIRVLLVDDNDMVRATIAQRLRLMGYAVEEAASGIDALDMLSTAHDILITDIVLHHSVDGWALAERARQVLPTLPIVFMSGYLSARQPEMMAHDELATFVRKPMESAELQAVIEGLLALRETRRLSRAGG